MEVEILDVISEQFIKHLNMLEQEKTNLAELEKNVGETKKEIARLEIVVAGLQKIYRKETVGTE